MKRDKYVDIVKGICIICVVYIHINIVGDIGRLCSNTLGTFITQFFLSVFFLISGFYLKNIDKFILFLKTKILKNYKRLVIYYIPFVLLHNFFITCGFYQVGHLYNTNIMEIYTNEKKVIKILETFLLMGREPLLGAVWFFIVQIMALIGLSILASAIKKVSNKYKVNTNSIFLFILFLCLCCSTVMTEKFHFTVPRASITLSIMILIYLGKIFKQDLKIKYNNIYIMLFGFIVLILNCIFVGKLQLNINQIFNPVTFLSSAIAGLYILCFIAKKIENNKLGLCLSICGKYSFEIMVFHLLCFKIPMYLIDKLNIEKHSTLSSLVPSTSNLFCFFLYMTVGITFPILIAKLLDYFKKLNLSRKEKN